MPEMSQVLETVEREIKRIGSDVAMRTNKMDARLDQLETAIQRSAGGALLDTTTDPEQAAAAIEHKEAFLSFLRDNNARDLRSLETKLDPLFVGNDPAGGYTVPVDVQQKIIRKLVELSPMRRIASVATIASGSAEFLVDVDDAEVRWTDELEERPPTATPKLGRATIVAHELTANPLVSQRLLDDSTFDIQTWLVNKVATGFARKEGVAFTTGSGRGQPRGLLTYPAGTSGATIRQIASGGAAGVTADALLNAIYSLKSGYLANARWLMARSTVLKVRSMKASDGTFLWQPALSQGQPATLAGFPIETSEDMPDAGAAGALGIAFGDFQQTYQIVDRLGIRTLQDPFTRKPLVEFATTKRVGGDVINFEAVVLIKTGVSAP